MMLGFSYVLACSKDDPEPVYIPTEVCVATKHHSYPVPNLNLYIKYNDSIFPGITDFSVYDTIINMGPPAYTCVEDLPFGTHMFVAYGWDAAWNDDVIGIRKVEISLAETRIDFDMEVNE